MSKSLIRKNQLHPDIADLVGEYGSGYFISNNSTVFTTGNQTIGGKKTFTTGIVSPLGIGNPGDVSDAEIRLWETSSESYQSIGSVDGGFTFSKGAYEINLEFDAENIHLSGPGLSYRFLSGYEGTVPINANVVHVTGGNERISGVKTFADSGIFFKGLDLQNSPIINSVPQLVTQTGNFSISGNSNGRMIISNVSTLITGTIMSGNATGFNASIIQVGAGQIQITGVGAGIKIDSYNNQYRTAGQFATISLLHTGNNGYIMYGNTST